MDDLKFIVIIPPSGGMIVEQVHNNNEVQELVQKYCGFDRIFVDTPLGFEYMVYASSLKNEALPVNISLSWIVGGGKAENVVECNRGYGVICRYVPGNSTFEDSITGFTCKEVPALITRLQKMIPRRSFSFEDEIYRV